MTLMMKSCGVRRNQLAAIGLWGTALATGGCNLSLNTDEIEGDLKESVDKVADLEVCDGMTLEELANAQTLSEQCKQQLTSFLPEPEDNFESRLVILGQEERTDGSIAIYLHGVDSTGAALDASALANLQVSVTASGTAQTLTDGEFTLNTGAGLPTELMSIGFVNDYSGSMSDADLEVTSEIEQDIIAILPDVFEGEVTQFSTEVVLEQGFTTDRELLSKAVGFDPSFERDLTALYDGMGTGLSSLSVRQRPVRLLVVATDGKENESQIFEKPELLQIIEEENICVLMLGSLFSEPAELKQFARICGAYFYTPAYPDLKTAVSEYVASLGALTEVVVAAEARGEGTVTLEVGDLSARAGD